MSSKNKWASCLLLIFLLLLGIFIYLQFLQVNKFHQDYAQPTKEKLCLDFLTAKMSSPEQAIYTNYLNLNCEGVETRGHAILAESEGLILIYYLNNNNKKAFDIHFNYLIKKMLLPNKLIGWRIVDNKLSSVSATVDQLRIIKVLLKAYAKWGDSRYKNTALELGQALKKYSSQEGILVDFYDSQRKATNITTAYLDLAAFTLLSHYDSEWKVIKNKSKKILSLASISSDFPLYRKTYFLTKKDFVQEENIEVLPSLIIALNKAEDGEKSRDFLHWLEKNLTTDGAIYSQYNIKTFQATNKVESTAIYALAALLAIEENDRLLYEKMLKLMVKRQVRDIYSPIYGAFGLAGELEVYSFDNLQALLALQKGEKIGFAE